MMRIVLEGLAARSGATLRTQTEVAILEELVDEFAEAVDKSDLWMMVSANRAFHETIADASRNTFLMRQLKALRLAIERMDQTTLVSAERQRETLDEHRAVLAAIAEQDAALAERLTREHFEKALKLRVRQSHARLRERRLAQRSDQTRS
jgi:DNA-binding GntR family transcriptional regulator